MLVGRRLGGTPSMSRPSRRITPPEISSNPAIARRSVVLPQPERPQQRKELTGPDLGRDAAQRVVVAVVFLHTLERDDGLLRALAVALVLALVLAFGFGSQEASGVFEPRAFQAAAAEGFGKDEKQNRQDHEDGAKRHDDRQSRRKAQLPPRGRPAASARCRRGRRRMMNSSSEMVKQISSEATMPGSPAAG